MINKTDSGFIEFVKTSTGVHYHRWDRNGKPTKSTVPRQFGKASKLTKEQMSTAKPME